MAQNEQAVSGGVKWILKFEGLCTLIACCFFYGHEDYSWKLFFLLFFLPDVSFLGYFVSPKIGAMSYNIAHSYILPIMMGVSSIIIHCQVLTFCTVIWIAHIGFDRALGYGLKYQTGFGDTHLGKIGKWRIK